MWTSPTAARPGANDLEVRVTNLWPNRLIGDEQFPDDCEWDWLQIKGLARMAGQGHAAACERSA